MLTGDSSAAAQAVARSLGINPHRVHAGTLPGLKAKRVKALQVRYALCVKCYAVRCGHACMCLLSLSRWACRIHGPPPFSPTSTNYLT